MRAGRKRSAENIEDLRKQEARRRSGKTLFKRATQHTKTAREPAARSPLYPELILYVYVCPMFV